MTFNPQPVPKDYTNNLVQSLRAQRAVGDLAEKKDRASFRRKAVGVGLLALTAIGVGKYAYDQPSEVDTKPKVAYVMQPGDTASSVASDYNPNEDVRNEADYIHSQDPNGDGKFEGGEQVMVPYTELPDANKESVNPGTAGNGPRG